jgi:ribosomal-protein-alanine N-acetyltransferase
MSALDPIITPRLRLVLTTGEIALASLTDRGIASTLIGAEVPEGWPEIHLRNFFPILIERLVNDPDGLQWAPRAIVLADENMVIGDIGVHAPPDRDGEVEFGYSLLPPYRGHGYATEASRALIAWAFARPGIRAIRATCDVANTASIRVLEKSGMTRVSEKGEGVTWVILRSAEDGG